LDKKDSRTMRQ